MTQRERLLDLLKDFGIEPELDTDEHYGGQYTATGPTGGQFVDLVTLEANKGGVLGYSYFTAIFAFDSDGKFVDVGIWE